MILLNDSFKRILVKDSFEGFLCDDSRYGFFRKGSILVLGPEAPNPYNIFTVALFPLCFMACF